MRGLTQLLYGVSRLVLLALFVAFLSFWLLTLDGFDSLESIADYGTKYIPLALLPVSAAMVVVLLMRWMAVNKHEEVGFADFLAFVVAVAMQVAVIVVYRAQGNDVAGPFAANIPDIEQLTTAAEPYGMLGVAILQLGAFIFYWIADPDPKSE